MDLVTCSGSGLDPEISPGGSRATRLQRIAKARGIWRWRMCRPSIEQVSPPADFLGMFGEPRVNVLKVNLALDGLI